MEKNKFSFEEVFKQNENRIYYHLQKLGIRDHHNEFYMEGLYAMWIAYKKYQPDKGPLSTYFNYHIRNHLIDTLRKETRQQEKLEKTTMEKYITEYHGNRHGDSKMPIVDSSGIELEDEKYWRDIASCLSTKQRKWLHYHIMLDMPLKEIAEIENTSVEAVKSWGKEARRKLRSRIDVEGWG